MNKTTLAKLLATENISVVHNINATTASFNVGTRLLKLPIFLDMSSEVYDMFVGHEVAHALWTPNHTELEDLVNLHPSMMSILNVVEDARIERMIKKQYPGLKRNFVKGYTELFESGFFGVTADEIEYLNVLDRLNINAKLKGNYALDVPFTDAELIFVDKLENTQTFEDTIQVSRELLKFAIDEKNKSDKKSKESGQDSQGSQENSEGSEGSQENSEGSQENSEGSEGSQENSEGSQENSEGSQENSEGSQGSEGSRGSEGSLGSEGSEGSDISTDLDIITQKNINEAFINHKKDINSKSNRNIYIVKNNTDIDIDLDNIIVSPKTIHDLLRSGKGDYTKINEYYKKATNEYIKNNSKITNYMVKKFELKKAAKNYRNISETQMGSLDMKKLHSYKFNDNIFLTGMDTKDEKNHGIYALVDWSGSVRNEFNSMLDQVLNTALFCRKAGIHFEAYGFTNERDKLGHDHQLQPIRCKNGGNTSTPSLSLLTLFSGSKKAANFTQEVNNVYVLKSIIGQSSSHYWGSRTLGQYNSEAFALYGTPLNAALPVLNKIIKESKIKNKLEKTSALILTDGYDNGCYSDIQAGKKISIKTTKSYKTFDTDETKDLYDYIKIDSCSKVIIMHISHRLHLDYYGYKYDNSTNTKKPINPKVVNDQYNIHNTFKKNKYQVFTNNGFDVAYVLHPSLLNIQNNLPLDSIGANVTMGKLKTMFSKSTSSKIKSRFVLDHLIDTIG